MRAPATGHADTTSAAKSATGPHATTAHASGAHSATAAATAGIRSVSEQRQRKYGRNRNRTNVYDCSHRSLLRVWSGQKAFQQGAPAAALPGALAATRHDASVEAG
jgi:hypothetical protein